MRRGDVYMVDLEPIQRREEHGYRPIVIVSPDDFNQATGLPVILPITSGGNFARRIGFAVPLMGTRTRGVIRCDQPRVLDLVVRNGRKVESLPTAIMDEVLAKVVTIFS
ncbi:type II toxin-antitoxin system PemK/MazF family toxin [Bartonella vinsonii]|uniref:PemK protein n=1 Tax=Bartonella vinsonii subsp. berkhoffii str. Tweed TaxID=1094502 RepID=N6UR28_BARVB|nr:type II toxin-antitoxin system PemK/MazF family toxin [Bartonella vinsonii]ENN94001.1 PemK protein [Bartonella vinsonii subsp. berkhoffii str. Tweed]ENN94814.1 PemK protein [Bartonella vinsonii subsp. berkhoffii str. Tweed]